MLSTELETIEHTRKIHARDPVFMGLILKLRLCHMEQHMYNENIKVK